MLSCSCPDPDYDDVEWFWYDPNDFTEFQALRRKRCCSCKKHMIALGEQCLEFKRFRYPAPDSIEADIKGEDAEIPIASHWMCEKCGEIYLNLEDLGYCMDITEPMEECLQEYHEMRGFQPGGKIMDVYEKASQWVQREKEVYPWLNYNSDDRVDLIIRAYLAGAADAMDGGEENIKEATQTVAPSPSSRNA